MNQANRWDRWMWVAFFWATVLGYCAYYAPYGINETDGGFLTGLAWQLLSGKSLYADVVYVRPPLPVWWRALELLLLPETAPVLVERWLFYGKVAAYCWLGASVLAAGSRRWMLATLGFVVSAHCYPAAAWHTVDGLLLGALSIWAWYGVSGRWGGLLSGVCMCLCLLCKQSFYPMALIWLVMVVAPPGWQIGQGNPGKKRSIAFAFSGMGLAILLFFSYLYLNTCWAGFWQMTTGAASGGEGFQHGVLDYLRIAPVLAGASALCLIPVLRWFGTGRYPQTAFWAWVLWLGVLGGSYAWAIWQRQDFTAPFAQSRLAFVVAVGYLIFQIKTGHWTKERGLRLLVLLGLSWCAALSWGYNLPILFAVPWVMALLDISSDLFAAAFPGRRAAGAPVWVLLALLLVFRWGYAFVYRDGLRSEMNIPLGDIFPRLRGIYSTQATAARYRDLRDLIARYGPTVKTLPAFPQSNFLTNTAAPLPLDWVVRREMQGAQALVEQALAAQSPVLLVEKAYADRLDTDPELGLTRRVLREGRVVEETEHFWVVRGPLSPAH